ncbi:MFS transporter [Streptomyces sp. Inha503]|uniref:MFS transporter n=1 Tax=Streptomyces sp. Inha503 TaxID=3383314 RepID=UPI0039A08218
MFLPVTGRLADLYGKKRAGYGLMRDILPARLVPLGVGGIGIGTGVSVLVGPLLGGYLIDHHGFRSAFWFELCYAVVAALLVLLAVPESRVRERSRVDVLGGVLLGPGMAAVVYAVVETALLPVLVPLGAALLALFAVVDRRREEPLVSMRLLGSPRVWWPLLAAGTGMYALTAGTTLLSEMVSLTYPASPTAASAGRPWSSGCTWALRTGSSARRPGSRRAGCAAVTRPAPHC